MSQAVRSARLASKARAYASPATIADPVTVAELVEKAAGRSSDFDGWCTEVDEN
jgi:hypothetical protein